MTQCKKKIWILKNILYFIPGDMAPPDATSKQAEPCSTTTLRTGELGEAGQESQSQSLWCTPTSNRLS